MARFTSFSQSIEISTAPAVAWAVIADVARWPTWTPTMLSVVAIDAPCAQAGPHPTPNAELERGSRYRVKQPGLPPAVMVVTGLMPGGSFTWTSSGRWVWAVARHMVSPAPGGCKVELVLDFHGPLASLVGILKGALVRRYLRVEAECLQAAAVRAALAPAH